MLEPVIVTDAVQSTAQSAPVPQNLVVVQPQLWSTILVPSYTNILTLLALIVQSGKSLPPDVLMLLAPNQSKLIVQAQVFAVVNLPTNICPVV